MSPTAIGILPFHFSAHLKPMTLRIISQSHRKINCITFNFNTSTAGTCHPHPQHIGIAATTQMIWHCCKWLQCLPSSPPLNVAHYCQYCISIRWPQRRSASVWTPRSDAKGNKICAQTNTTNHWNGKTKNAIRYQFNRLHEIEAWNETTSRSRFVFFLLVVLLLLSHGWITRTRRREKSGFEKKATILNNNVYIIVSHWIFHLNYLLLVLRPLVNQSPMCERLSVCTWNLMEKSIFWNCLNIESG